MLLETSLHDTPLCLAMLTAFPLKGPQIAQTVAIILVYAMSIIFGVLVTVMVVRLVAQWRGRGHARACARGGDDVMGVSPAALEDGTGTGTVFMHQGAGDRDDLSSRPTLRLVNHGSVPSDAPLGTQ